LRAVNLLVLAVELLFVILFLATLVQYVRRRDPVSRGVMLTFGALAALFVLTLVRTLTGGATPAILTIVAGTLFFLQPAFTLHLVALIRRVPTPVFLGATIATIGTGLPLIVAPTALPREFAFVAIGTFIAVEALSAVYLLIEARHRSGPGAIRLALAGISTGLFGLALLFAIIAGAAGANTGSTQLITGLVALAAAIGYIVAFVPPGSVRRFWQAGTTVGYTRALIARSAESVQSIWTGFATIAAATTGGAAAIVIGGRQESASIVATAGLPPEAATIDCSRADLEELLAAADDGPERRPDAAGSLADRLARLAGAQFASVVRVGESAEPPAALLLLSRHRSLFHASDLDLLATLGTQTAIVAERRAILAEQEALSQRLAASVEALRSASEAKSDFLASMSHELRTPLSAILGFSELMRLEPRQDDKIPVPADWVDHIHRGGEHLLSLINDVLDLSKVEAGRLELRPEPVDLPAAIAESVAGLRPLAERKRIELIASVSELNLTVDRGRLRQIVYNLLSNAIKYTPDGGTIRIAAQQNGGDVRIAVTDTGIGIAPKDHAAVFEEFRQVGDPASRQPGTGLGLALTRRLVEAHGGGIELESDLGKGSTFTVVLPTGMAVSAPQTMTESSARLQPARAASSTVLVVEDDPSAVRLLREYLEPAGYEVRVAADGSAGIDVAAQLRPMAIVLDVLLPGIDGWEVLRRLKAQPLVGDVPVIMLTVVDERDVGLALGAADYLVKPIQRDALLASVSRFAPRPTTSDAPLRVLAVDDEPSALELIRSTLASEGFAVTAVPTGREALDVARRERFDFVVVDLVMPELDGFDVIAALKSDPQTAGVPILVCTARDLTEGDKERLNGQILGITSKGTDGRDGLRAWLTRASRAPNRRRTRSTTDDALARG
jgi:signal transduction histidine kinase/DNA-binding response OmpR family regulator